MRPAALALTLTCLSISPAAAQQATITAKDCRQLVEHQAAPDVAYRPGVDARGRPVAPADLNPQPQLGAPESFTMDLNVSLQGRGIPATSPLFQPQVGVGKLTVEDGGRKLYLNGQPLGNAEQQALADACKKLQAQPQGARPMTGPMKLN